MRVLVINVPLRPDSSTKYFPIGLSYVVSGARRAGYEIDILDLDAHSLPMKEVSDFISRGQYDVIGMGCIVTGYRHIKTLASLIREVSP